ncbi:MAG: GldG family protein [Lachnospiraceae bacterium]|jgi:ABC-2 type transport system permease protein|nr:GldG family protein [Lachnospiraceae bacterium]
MKEKILRNRIALQGGSYSLIITVIILAILVAVNILVYVLPKSLTQLDISSTKLYSITSNTKVVVNALEKDVTIYWIVQSDKEDDVIENLLDKYESLSEHIKVVKKNPDIYPTFAEQYTKESVQNNSLVVECGDRSRFISYDDIYLYDANMSSYSYDVSFDGEGAITSAIDYVVNEDQPEIYVLEGHGEAELSESFREQLEKENIELNTFSLLTADAVPEDADGILIYGPSSDISEEEKTLLAEYVSGGGKLMVLAGLTKDGTLTNLYSILKDYGVDTVDGIVVDTDRGHYAFQAPYILLPDLNSSEITDPLIEENYYAIMPVAQGLTIQDTESGRVTELLTTSEMSFSKTDGYALSSYEKEEGDTDGPFILAVSVAAENGGQIVWFASSSFLDEMYNAYSSGANLDLAINAMSSIIGENEAVAIRSKSLNYNYLTISDSTASFLKTIMIAVFPLMYLGIGICVIIGRRRWNEAK